METDSQPDSLDFDSLNGKQCKFLECFMDNPLIISTNLSENYKKITHSENKFHICYNPKWDYHFFRLNIDFPEGFSQAHTKETLKLKAF